MASKRLDITVAADRTVTTVFEPLLAASARARARIKSDAEKSAADEEKAALRAAAAAAKAFAQIEAMSAKAAAKEAADADKAAQAKERAIQREFDQRLRAAKRAADAEEREILRTAAAAEKAEERKAAAAAKARGQRNLDIARETKETLFGVARAGVGIAGDIARGAGVNFDLSSSVQRSVGLEASAVQLSNAAFRGAEGEERIDPKELVKQARAIGDEFRLDPSKVIGGLAKFQEFSGDLKTANVGLREWSMLAKASNTPLEEMIGTAGQISVALGDAFASPEEKVKAITKTVKIFGAQGQEGAIEYGNLVSQFPKLQAAASKFEGDAGANLAKMGRLVQIARQYGGAPSATAAATSIAGLGNILSTPARVKAFAAEGIDVFSKKKGEEGKVRDIDAIMKDALAKTGMDPLRFKALFANVVGAKPAEGIASVYREAGGGEKGMSAVDALYKKFDVEWKDEKVKGDLAAAMGTVESKAQAFQNNLDLIASSMAERVLPALEKLAPKVLELADSLGRLIGWAAENPGSAIVAAIVGSIAKAMVGNAIKDALISAIKGLGGGAPMPPVPGGAGGAGMAPGASGVVLVAGLAMAKIVEENARENEEIAEPEWGGGSFGGKAGAVTRGGAVRGKRRNRLGGTVAQTGGITTLADIVGTVGVADVERGGVPASSNTNVPGIDRVIALLQTSIEVARANKPPKNVTVDNMPASPGPTAARGENTVAPALSK